jgi:hypothetical protein
VFLGFSISCLFDGDFCVFIYAFSAIRAFFDFVRFLIFFSISAISSFSLMLRFVLLVWGKFVMLRFRTVCFPLMMMMMVVVKG